MVITIFNVKRLPNENEAQYLWRICQAKDAGTFEADWETIADLMNQEFRADVSEYKSSSAYRKKYQYAKALFDDGVFNTSESEYAEEISEQIRLLEQKRVQFRDERNAWNEQNRIEARVKQKLDYLEGQLGEIGRIEFKQPTVSYDNSDKDMLILLSDWHIGETFASNWGAYNTDIAAERLNKLMASVLDLKKKNGAQRCYVACLGDFLSGNIHRTLQVSNRENVMQQVKIASQLLASFLYTLSSEFEEVIYASVVGNHSRITRKEEAVHDERLDDIIAWGVELLLSDVKNVHRKTTPNYDSGIACLNIKDKLYVLVHGDFDPASKSGIANLSLFLHHVPYCVLMGHYHTPNYSDANGVRVIRGGCLSGSGSDYTIEKRLSGDPSQVICICKDGEVEGFFPISLK